MVTAVVLVGWGHGAPQGLAPETAVGHPGTLLGAGRGGPGCGVGGSGSRTCGSDDAVVALDPALLARDAAAEVERVLQALPWGRGGVRGRGARGMPEGRGDAGVTGGCWGMWPPGSAGPCPPPESAKMTAALKVSPAPSVSTRVSGGQASACTSSPPGPMASAPSSAQAQISVALRGGGAGVGPQPQPEPAPAPHPLLSPCRTRSPPPPPPLPLPHTHLRPPGPAPPARPPYPGCTRLRSPRSASGADRYPKCLARSLLMNTCGGVSARPPGTAPPGTAPPCPGGAPRPPRGCTLSSYPQPSSPR